MPGTDALEAAGKPGEWSAEEAMTILREGARDPSKMRSDDHRRVIAWIRRDQPTRAPASAAGDSLYEVFETVGRETHTACSSGSGSTRSPQNSSFRDKVRDKVRLAGVILRSAPHDLTLATLRWRAGGPTANRPSRCHRLRRRRSENADASSAWKAVAVCSARLVPRSAAGSDEGHRAAYRCPLPPSGVADWAGEEFDLDVVLEGSIDLPMKPQPHDSSVARVPAPACASEQRLEGIDRRLPQVRPVPA